MSAKLVELAKKLNISSNELKKKIIDLGFEISPRARVIEDDIAELVFEELKSDSLDAGSAASIEEPTDVAEIYDEIIGREQDREIIKTQRKKTYKSAKSYRYKYRWGFTRSCN